MPAMTVQAGIKSERAMIRAVNRDKLLECPLSTHRERLLEESKNFQLYIVAILLWLALLSSRSDDVS